MKAAAGRGLRRVPILRLLRSLDEVTFEGRFFIVRGRRAPAGAAARHLAGRIAPGAAPRGTAGRRLAGQLPDARGGGTGQAIEAAAAEAGREIEPDHYGISLTVAEDASLPRCSRWHGPPPGLRAGGAGRAGWASARALMEGYVRPG